MGVVGLLFSLVDAFLISCFGVSAVVDVGVRVVVVILGIYSKPRLARRVLHIWGRVWVGGVVLMTWRAAQVNVSVASPNCGT